MRIMLRYNVDMSRGLVNGSIGTVVEIQFPSWRRRPLHPHDIPKLTV